MTKRHFLAVLCAAAALALLPAAALAGADVQICVVTTGLSAPLSPGKYFPSNGTAQQDAAPPSGGYAHLSADGATLSLNHFQLTNDHVAEGISIATDSDVTLDLTGASVIEGMDSYGFVISPDQNPAANYTLTVRSRTGGSLKATADWNGIGVIYGNLTVESGTLHGVSMGKIGNSCSGIVVTNEKLSTTPPNVITVTGGKLISEMTNPAPVYPQDNCGIDAREGDLTVSGGEVTGAAAGINGRGIYG